MYKNNEIYPCYKMLKIMSKYNGCIVATSTTRSSSVRCECALVAQLFY